MVDEPSSGSADLGEVRHALKNVLTSLKSGCYLIERSLQRGDAEEAGTFVVEMRGEIDRGLMLADKILAGKIQDS